MNSASNFAADSLRALIRDVPDFPSPGITFRDITPLLAQPAAMRDVLDRLLALFRDARVEIVAAVESRGFILGAPLAIALGAGFVPIRKVGKLPSATIRRGYDLEYGSNHLEIHTDAIRPGQRVLLIDDVLATGGTAAASVELLEELDAVVVAVAFLIELAALNGRSRLERYPVASLVTY